MPTSFDIGIFFFLSSNYINLLLLIDAFMKDTNNGCGARGLDFNSGWNWTPINHG